MTTPPFKVLRERFEKIYNNLSEGAKKEIVAVHNEHSYSFEEIKVVVSKNIQPTGYELLESLWNLDIIA